MNAEFYETELSIDEVLFDLFIDQLHQFAEMELEEDLAAPLWVSSSADRATAF